ncbi:hypothetical protein AFERRI_400315 [Acidithiobacillus ferrivorans]|uniref:Uncharacterized protein n=1 Tax=Acidithiobacillus ferrivorans TaxID=160808 RepID=A0A060UVH1_9PROT|nr:hypothetical protein AFERRI_400315 [Acidithiobacillus ferrivorans]
MMCRQRIWDLISTVSDALKSGIWRTRTRFFLFLPPGCGYVRPAATKDAQKPRITVWIAPAATNHVSLGLDTDHHLPSPKRCRGVDQINMEGSTWRIMS